MPLRILLVPAAILATAQASAAALGDPQVAAPAAPGNAAYCLKVEAVTGTRLETVVCRTRGEWAEWGIDVDKEWAKEGVRVINA